MIEVVKAPPFATVQDLGWRTGRAMGLPQSGAMDRALLERANRCVGNAPGEAALEWALGAGALRFDQPTEIGVLDDAQMTLDGVAQETGALTVPAGAVLELVPGRRDRFVYLAVRGGIGVRPVLGSRSTYLPGGFGGYEGRRLKTGDRLPIGVIARPQRGRGDPEGGIASGQRGLGDSAGVIARPQRGRGDLGEVVLTVTRGPQWDRFGEDARREFFAGTYTVTPASDRMGYRLQGPAVRPLARATLPSEAACVGAVQIPDDGQPIVLMPDGPTVGGYPKMVVVTAADIGKLAQCHPGRAVRFTHG
jgi:biotin-dependent carboxylase-like uncharacterized protein